MAPDGISDDIRFQRLAVAEAGLSTPEDDKPHPKVGVVVIKNGDMLAKAHRGEQLGDHAEFTALEKKLSEEILAGATVYTTLEPCTTRNHPKIPCAERLIERKVKRVVMGMLDPNPSICGKGQRLLRDANIVTDFFAPELMQEIEDMNRHFTRHQKTLIKQKIVESGFVERYSERPLDDWYKVTNYMYWDTNFHRDPTSVFAHLAEVIGGLSLLASEKTKPNVDSKRYVAKAVAWWMALCGKVGVKSVGDMLWVKFPGVCAYCRLEKHEEDPCLKEKREHEGPNWRALAEIGRNKSRPSSLGEWQRMFYTIYPAGQNEPYGPSFARLTEELGELAEAVRVFPAAPGYFISEASDVFAWLMHVQNVIERKAETGFTQKGQSIPKRGRALELMMCQEYPDYCKDCGNQLCSCPPILDSTIGRIAHEVPPEWVSFGPDGNFMTVDKARLFFRYKHI